MATQKRTIPPLYIGVIMFALGLFLATLLHTKQFSPATLSADPAEIPLFELQSQAYLPGDLSYAAANALYNLEQETFEQKTAILKRAALHVHLDNLAAKRGVSREVIREELIPSDPVTDDDIAQFYENNKSKIRQPFYQIKDAIRNALTRDRVNQVENKLTEQLEKAGQLTFLITPPTPPTVELELEGYASAGPENASVVIAEFIDYKCSHCKIASNTLKDIQQKYPDKVRLVTLDFPILGKISHFAAKAAVCAQTQGSYWSMHDAMFEHQSSLNNQKILEIASELSLNTEQLVQCISAADTEEKTAATIAQAQKLGLTGTPAIFINGMAYRGSNLEAALRDAVKDAIAVSP